MVTPIQMTADKFMSRRSTLIQYLRDRVEAYDWHAVADAACDLRVLEAEWSINRALQPKWTDGPVKTFQPYVLDTEPPQPHSARYQPIVDEMNARHEAK
jgi:hypothetical protein